MMKQDNAVPIIEVRNMTMQFGDFIANKNITICLYSNQIHAIIGENGAGKSTLMKVLYGINKPSRGEILIDGKPRKLDSPARQ